ncbi:MAG TPA: L-fucose:H+ symporter permease [Gammaproteobacteria bacterium]|nr:L-fucose:H+ symporter permease [Gammaproteobacteria bacterium]
MKSTQHAHTAAAGSFIGAGYRPAFVLVTSLFFMWALANGLNDILVKQFQKALALNRGQAGFIQFAFYIGYFVMALPAGLVMRRFGYKNSILFGLLLYMTGALLFYPAAETRSYAFFLAALFVIASGLTFLETAANPYITVMGGIERGPQRLNLAQSFNGLGVSLAPLLGGIYIFSGVELSEQELARMSPAEVEAFRIAEAGAVQVPYLVLAGAVALVAFLIAITRMPQITPPDEASGDGHKRALRELMAAPHLKPAVIAQAFYVGAQVCVWSYFIDYSIEVLPGTTEKQAAHYLWLSLTLFMLGRFLGTLLMQFISPARLLAAYAGAGAGLCGLAIALDGIPAVVALGLTSPCMSIMFPTIFALGIRGLGKHTELGASLIVMAIIGGAILPPAMGFLSEYANMRLSVALPLACFLAVLLFALRETYKLESEKGA